MPRSLVSLAFRVAAAGGLSGRQSVAILTGACLMVTAVGVPYGFAWAGGSVDPLQTKTITRAYSDVRTDLQNAIINQGLTIDYNGKLGDMLKRTAKDVGAKGDLYIDAEYFTFCSSRLSRKMMDADPVNMGLCPYMMFLYERVGNEGKVTVGYKEMPMRGDEGSQKALTEINTLLEAILQETAE